MGNPHKIDAADMVDQLTKKPEVISLFNNIVNESGVKNFLPELKININLTLKLIDINFISSPKSQNIFKGKRYYK